MVVLKDKSNVGVSAVLIILTAFTKLLYVVHSPVFALVETEFWLQV